MIPSFNLLQLSHNIKLQLLNICYWGMKNSFWVYIKTFKILGTCTHFTIIKQHHCIFIFVQISLSTNQRKQAFKTAAFPTVDGKTRHQSTIKTTSQCNIQSRNRCLNNIFICKNFTFV